ncbi:CYTH and CHAD domain-containing protein [Nesterenkonia sandarakina]|uniref:CHAD domain-containing protein n=1 Tax=Nesterenkonia sandarakina TaxID=272918 RepID=A0A7Z0J206_9MICC|nr:CYTH and CHAD domain-containing protein [Nesterenkonia sandarakina]NYJ15770.1 CHAD domain-containing protein [Nesterenkonia sandarakina]
MDAEPASETERKFDVPENIELPQLTDLPGVKAVDQPIEHRLETEYFDTADLRLASRSITLGRRIGDEDAGWELRHSARADERRDHHARPRRTSDDVPKTLLQRVRVYSRDSALMPVARLRTRRIVYRLRDDDGDAVAAFTDDHVNAQTLHPEPASQSWREWDFELCDAPKDLLNAGNNLILAAGGHPSAHGSELARALGTFLHNTVKRDSSPPSTNRAGDVVFAYLQEQLEVIRDQDPRVRQDDHDAVHKMRVATRRLRSVLATYGSLLEDRDTVHVVRGELRWLAGVLATARDTEVMQGRLMEMIANEPAELLSGPVARRIETELGGDYKKAYRRVMRALNGKRYFRLLDSLESLIGASTLSPRGAKPAKKALPPLINQDIKRLRRAVKHARRHPAGTGDPSALHDVRKDAKRLRYAAEAARTLGRKETERLAETAHGIQKILGDYQDTVVTRALLRRLGAEAFAQGENAFSYGRLHALEQSTAVKAEAAFHRGWQRIPTLSAKK